MPRLRFPDLASYHMWVKFVVGSRPCSEKFFSEYSSFPLSSKTNTSKFQFDLDYCQALYHEPLAREIAQALPVLLALKKYVHQILSTKVKINIETTTKIIFLNVKQKRATNLVNRSSYFHGNLLPAVRCSPGKFDHSAGQ